MAIIETWVKQDLKQPVRMIYPKGNFFEDDNNGNLVGVRVFDGDTPSSLTGSCVGYCVLSNGASIPVNGTVSGNTAYIVIPSSVYTVPGPVIVVIKNVNISNVVTLAAICITVIGTGGTVGDPSAAVIAEWTAAINAAIATVQGNSVRFDASQSLTAEQKAQAKSNIGATYTAVLISGDDYKIVCP